MSLSRVETSVRSLVVRCLCGAVLLGAVLLLPAPVSAAGPAAPPVTGVRGTEVGPPVTPFSFDGDVRSLPAPAAWKAGDPVRFIPRRDYGVAVPGADEPQPFVEDPLLQLQLDAEPQRRPTGFTTPILNVDGEAYTGASPPDTVGDVGLNHYIQAVNSGGGTKVRILDKAGSLISTFTLDSLGSGNCGSGLGDPIVLYDRQADRWMLSEFSGSGNYLCVYISKTADPVSGGWWHYGFQCPSFPDYPKYSVWPTDANGGLGSYIVTANDGGPGIYALDRGKMLSGLAATFQRTTADPLGGYGFQGVYAPADVDGASGPPSGAGAIISAKRDTEKNGAVTPTPAGDVLQMYEFQVDWVTPANSTLVGPTYPDIADFDADVCGLTTWDCVPQPNTGDKLDPLREPVMHRLQYWNHGTYESLVGCFTVDAVPGTDQIGIRWFEMRRTTGGWTAFAQGTYSPDTVYRWMGSAAADQTGNIAIGYSVSDASSVYPGLRYAGRNVGDPAGQMTQGEITLVSGDTSQGFNRWGDYAAMGVDPADDCTFWFTSEYMVDGVWKTRIAAFKFDQCGCVVVPAAPVASAAVAGENRIDLAWDDNVSPTVTGYRVLRATEAAGPFAPVAEVGDTSPGVGSGAGYTWTDSSVSGGSTYYYSVAAREGAYCISPESAVRSVTATGACTLSPTFAGVVLVANAQESGCGLVVSWAAAASRCTGEPRYSIYRSTLPGFTPGPSNRIAYGVSGTSYTDRDGLAFGQRYYYIVRAWDSVSRVEDGNLVAFGDLTTGAVTVTTPFSEDFSGVTLPSLPASWLQTDVVGTAGSWTTLLKPTHPSTTAHSVPNSLMFNSYRTSPSTAYSSRVYRNVAIAVPSTALEVTLSFAMYHDTLSTRRDSVQVQVSEDGGTTWVNTGAPVLRNLGAPAGWRMHSVNLIDYRGKSILLGLLGSTSSGIGGTDINLDSLSLTIRDGGPCSTLQRPPEVSPGTEVANALTWTSASSLAWQAPSGAAVDGYQLCRGTGEDLKDLVDPTVDSCVRWTGTSTSATGLSEPPPGVEGQFYWYLAVAQNAAGWSPAGTGAPGLRQLDWSGSCD